MNSKILAIGDVNGQIKTLFTKINILHKTHHFNLIVIVGNLFAKEEDATDTNNEEMQALLDGKIEVPTSTYFALGPRALPKAVLEKLDANDGELCENLSVLGRKVFMTTAEGLRICAVGGIWQKDIDYVPSSTYEPAYTDQDVMTAAGNREDCDLLITSHWPLGVGEGSRVQHADQMRGLLSIAQLCAKVKPRYHLTVSPLHFSREPFFHNGPAPRAVTRFMSLAPMGNPEGEKAISAFTLAPAAPYPQVLPESCTASPFDLMRAAKRKREPEHNYRYSNDSHSDTRRDDGRRNKKHDSRRDRPARLSSCFFCLSNPETETHMITSLGHAAYMTIAKGPLPTRETHPELDMPCHMLIIPICHEPTLAAMEQGERLSVIEEMAKYRDGLNKFILSKSDKLGSVTWVISRASGMHLHWQFMPAPLEVVKQGIVEAAFLKEAENLSYPRFAKSEDEVENAEDGDYFKVMIWSEGVKKDMVMPIDQNIKFDLQFGRRVMAKLLGMERRGHWKDCAQSKDEETADAEAFKVAFEKFDFTA